MLIALVALARDARLKPRAPTVATQLINARPIWLLRCSIRCLSRGSSPVAFARTDHSGRPIPRRHSLTLCPTSSAVALTRSGGTPSRRVVCACTLYLVFKEPTAGASRTPHPGWLPAFSWGHFVTQMAGSLIPPFGTCPKGLAAWPVAARLGEPSEVTSPCQPCQHICFAARKATPQSRLLALQSFLRTERSRSITYGPRYVKSTERDLSTERDDSASGPCARRTARRRSRPLA